MADKVHVIGSSGRSGAALCAALLRDGIGVVPIVRNPARWAATGIRLPARQAQITEATALGAALADATLIVNCAHARHAAAVIAAAPAAARFVFLGSTRRFSRWSDAHGRGVARGEAAFLASGRHGLMLHPTMIYGAAGEDNVRRLAALLRLLPVVPLPAGGRALVQPIYQDDVTRAILAAVAVVRREKVAEALVIAGPEPVTYRDFVAAIARASGLRAPRILTLPVAPLIAAAALSRLLPGVPAIRPSEIRRLAEDKAFDIGSMISRLGVRPVTLSIGLAQMFTERQTVDQPRRV